MLGVNFLRLQKRKKQFTKERLALSASLEAESAEALSMMQKTLTHDANVSTNLAYMQATQAGFDSAQRVLSGGMDRGLKALKASESHRKELAGQAIHRSLAGFLGD